MGILKKRGLTAALLICVMFIVTACFQQVGDDAGGQTVSQLITATNTLVPSATNTPTEEVEDVPISNVETNTPTPTNTATPTETEVPLVVAQAGDEGLFPTETDDSFEARATDLVATSTAEVVILTQQAQATLLGFTDTPTPTSVVPTQDLGQGGGDTGVVLTGSDCIHEVRRGETMFQLSRYYGISVNDIATRNGVVNPDLISIGQKFTITSCGTNNVLPPPTSVPTQVPTQFVLDSVAQGGSDLGQGGGAVTTTGTTSGLGCQAQYTVQQYDNLFQISITYGVSVQSIANANGITNLGYIDMGQVLCIPVA